MERGFYWEFSGKPWELADQLDEVSILIDPESDLRMLITNESKGSCSARQKRLYWIWVRHIGEHTGYSSKALDVYFRKLFLAEDRLGEDGSPRLRTVSELNKDEMSDLLTLLQRWAYKTIGVELDAKVSPS